MTTTLYLDYDGVLHEAVCLERDDLLRWSPLLIDALEPFPHVEIVLSTSWVCHRGFERTKAYLPDTLQRRVVGATYDPALHSATRFGQIVQHTERNNITNWVAIDDLYEHSERWDDAHHDRLVLTDPLKGLSDPAALARLQTLLREQEQKCESRLPMSEATIKYQSTPLPDYRLAWRKDDFNRKIEIEIEVDRLDSASLVRFLTFVLPNRHGINVVGNSGAVFLTLRGQRFEAQVHKDLERGEGEYTLILK